MSSRLNIGVVALVSLVAGCEERVTVLPIARPPLDEIVDGLRSLDMDEREVAAGRLARTSLSVRGKLRALTAAAYDLPSRQLSGADSAADLVNAAAREPTDVLLPVVREVFGAYSEPAQTAALSMIANMPSRAAAEAWVEIVLRQLDSGALETIPFGTLKTDPRHGDVFLPQLLAYADHESFGWDLMILALRICKKAPVDRASLRPAAAKVLELYDRYSTPVWSQQKREHSAYWTDDDSYATPRAYTSLLLDLLSCLPEDVAQKPVERAMAFRDPRLKYFAVASFVRLFGVAPRKRVAEVARHPEVREWLFDSLDEQDRRPLIPERYRTQEALAEGAMVRWLMHGDELGRPPDAIEFVERVAVDTETVAGIVDYYVFRFRSNVGEDNVWMAGVAGAYVRAHSPTTDNDGSVYSRYEPIDSHTAIDHVGDIDEIISRWRSYGDD